MYGWNRPRRIPPLVPFYLLAGDPDIQEQPVLQAGLPWVLEEPEDDEHMTDPGIGAADAECVFFLHAEDPAELDSE